MSTTTAKALYQDDLFVNHGFGQYVDAVAQGNWIEVFWGRLKRAHKCVYHYRMSKNHLHWHESEFECRHTIRERGTVNEMKATFNKIVEEYQKYEDLVSSVNSRPNRVVKSHE